MQLPIFLGPWPNLRFEIVRTGVAHHLAPRTGWTGYRLSGTEMVVHVDQARNQELAREFERRLLRRRSAAEAKQRAPGALESGLPAQTDEEACHGRAVNPCRDQLPNVSCPPPTITTGAGRPYANS